MQHFWDLEKIDATFSCFCQIQYPSHICSFFIVSTLYPLLIVARQHTLTCLDRILFPDFLNLPTYLYLWQTLQLNNI